MSLTAALVIALAASSTRAAIIHESATLGPTGQTGGGAWTVGGTQFLGSRFTLTDRVEVTAVGGHLLRLTLSGNFFAAITAISGPMGLPINGIGGPLSENAYIDWTPLATSVFDVPMASADVIVPMSITLDPGDYGLVFGTGLFGADGGNGGMPGVDHDIPGAASYFNFLVSSPSMWGDTSSGGTRFVVYGRVVPEPEAWMLAAGAVAGLGAIVRRRS